MQCIYQERLFITPTSPRLGGPDSAESDRQYFTSDFTSRATLDMARILLHLR